ncbi:YARHG domain-containing protein [Dorea longicatena]|uniref:YARHG domain-containing protein n=1 Tax=Dorea longicatena TaxID=88431 RepID=UPI0018A0F93F|nr:YARHG domain-containing protein [Dorea longicatena]
MRCRVCGSNNEDGSKFCWNCGNKLTEQSETRSSSVNQPGIQQNSGDVQHNQVGTPPKQVRMPQRQVPPGGFDWENGKKMAEERLQKGKNIADGCVGQLKRVAENQTITDKLKKISKKTWGIIGACVALVLVLLIVIALHKPTVNLNDYLKVTYGGYDGGGVAYTEIDWNSMKEDFENKISYKRGMAQTGGMTPIDIIMEYTNANIEGKNEKLSNGDKVSYTWKVDKDAIAKLIKCKIKYSDGSKKVSGLKEMELFDPFKNLKVTFSGVEPNGEADIEYNGDMLSEYDFTCDKSSGLKNGDKIKISLTEDAGYYVDQYNKAPSVLEKEYKVKNLGKYLSKIKEVDTDGMNSARAKAQKSISDMVDYWSEDVTLDKVSYAGDYLQVAKDSDDYTKNYYGVIYQINAHIQPDGGQRKDVVSYYSMKFENVIVGGDGKCEIDLDEYDVPYDDFSVEVTSGDLSSGSYSFDGYQTLEELKKNYVDEVADEFDCEWDVSGKLEAVDLGVTSDYLCFYSSDRLLTDSDVEGYLNANYSEYNFPEGINIIQMIINEIYAKHGYEFTDSKLSAYFSNKTWYKSNTNKVNDMNAVSDSMSEIEKKNVDFLNSYR